MCGLWLLYWTVQVYQLVQEPRQEMMSESTDSRDGEELAKARTV